MEENTKLISVFHEGEIKAISAILTRMEKVCQDNVNKVWNQGETATDMKKEFKWLAKGDHYAAIRKPFDQPTESAWAQVDRNELVEALHEGLSRSGKSEVVTGLLEALIYKIEDL